LYTTFSASYSHLSFCYKHKPSGLLGAKRTIPLRLTFKHDPIPTAASALNFIHI
jgi:hypothetical protein